MKTLVYGYPFVSRVFDKIRAENGEKKNWTWNYSQYSPQKFNIIDQNSFFSQYSDFIFE